MEIYDSDNEQVALVVKITGNIKNKEQQQQLLDALLCVTKETQSEKGLIFYNFYEIRNKKETNDYDYIIYEIWDNNESYARHINTKHTADFLALQYDNIITNIEFTLCDILNITILKKDEKVRSKILFECIINSDYSSVFMDSLEYFTNNLSKNLSCCGFNCHKKDINKKQNDDYRFSIIMSFNSCKSCMAIQDELFFINFINIINLITNKSLTTTILEPIFNR